MTRDEITEMARQAGFGPAVAYKEFMPPFERFAALVVSRHVKETRPKPDDSEREWLQQIAYQHGGIGDLCETEFEFGAMVAAAEREAILRHATPAHDVDGHCEIVVAADIRERGEK
jgi:hypothetical protein